MVNGNLAPPIKPGFQGLALGRHFLLAPIEPRFWPYFQTKCALRGIIRVNAQH